MLIVDFTVWCIMGALVWFRFTPNMASLETNKVIIPKTFSQVKGLSYRDVLVVCKNFNINYHKIGRDALDILVCEQLGISTTGSRPKLSSCLSEVKPKVECHCLDKEELSEFQSITPSLVNSLTNWTKDAKLLPDIDIGQVKKYLVSTENNEFSKDSLKTYKLTRSYQHLHAKHIHSVKLYHGSPTFCVVKAQCLPSQSSDNKRVKWLYAVLDKQTGEPYGGFCVCTVGRTQVCSHIGALLFLLCEIVASGESSLPADHDYTNAQSCTDMLCQWTDPKAATVTPITFSNVSLSKTNNRIKPTATSYVPQVAQDLTPEENYNRVLKLLYDVRNANDSSTMPPIVKIVDIGKFRSEPLPTPIIQTSLPTMCFDFDIPYSYEITVNSTPLSILDFPHQSFKSEQDLSYQLEKDRFTESIIYSKHEMLMIEELTRSQSESAEWFNQRKGAITSSRVIKIINFYKNGSKNPTSILKDILQHSPLQATLSKKVPSLSWGVKNEDRALHAFLKDYMKTHHAVQVSRTGLFVHPTYPYIRASPDAIISCECHGRSLVEVKCPYVHRNSYIPNVISEGKLEYISEDGTLKIGHSRGYFEQIIVQEAVTSINNAVMVIWSKKGYTAIDVPFARDYWQTTILPSAVQFFKEQIIPAILIPTRISGEKYTVPSTISVDVCCNPVDVRCQQSQPVLKVDENVESINHVKKTLIEIDSDNDGDDHESIDDASADDDGDNDDDDDEWLLGCKDYCKDDKAPKYSRVRGKLIACDANIVCLPNSWFHLYCEGHRRVPKSTNQSYACNKCRKEMPNKENMSSGFYT
ncbi:uncharacterized protein [Argopecten irradians]|uniref:uncharacterized protein n=1 Tax=Argopecten irradians TaxID=31199 RepID=UPI0037103404